MDLTLEYFDMERHLSRFWPIFSAFWKEVNQKDLEKMKNVVVDGQIMVTTELEEKLAFVMAEKIIKVCFNKNQAVGFLQYKHIEGQVVFIDSLYTIPEQRWGGVTRFLLNSLPKTKKILFQVHRDNKPAEMLKVFMNGRKVADCDDRDLELWEGEYEPNRQGSNPDVIQLRKEAKNE